MTTTKRYRTPVVQTTVEEGILEAEADVRVMEHRYGCSSEAMLEAVKSGETEETWEICKWLGAYHNLQALKAARGPAGGSRTSATGSSTRATAAP